MKIHIKIGFASKPKPRIGDRKIVKGVLCERRLERVFDHHGNPIGINKTGGRYHYTWEPVTAAA